MKIKNNPFKLSKISPFFQVKIKGNKRYSRKKFGKLLYKYCNADNKRRVIRIIGNYERPTSNIYILSVYTLPTWYKEKIDTSNITKNSILNITNEIVIINDYSEYLYIYSSDNKIQEIVEKIIRNHFSKPEVDIKKIYNIINNESFKIRTMGLVNTFGAGGIAVESKSYSGKNTKYSLTPSFDAGYSFNFCIASTEDSDLGASVGCSAKKRKVWSGWCSGITEFNDKCNFLTNILNEELSFKLPILVLPVSSPSKSLSVIAFYVDYTVKDRGNLYFNINGKVVTDWHIERKDEKNQEFIIGDSMHKFTIEISNPKNIPKFRYLDKNKNIKVFFSDDPSETKRKRKIDFIEYLNEHGNYTILFDNAYAYRDESHWFDNRLKHPFVSKTYKEISWNGVDITAEAKAPKAPFLKNISDATLDYIYERIDSDEILAVIEDNGANEVADHIIVCKDHLVLSHEKFSEEDYSGLRVGDLQVVIAQAIKNMKYFFPISYNERIIRLFDNAKYLDLSIRSPQDLYSCIENAITSQKSKNKIWIVQPGISYSKLESSENNKIHILLSFIDSVAKTNNSEFKFFCNS